jgi:pimeloyl-ACP methyl ester carboxylesterase
MGQAFESDRFEITLNKAAFHGYDSGGNGPVVLMLHGWPDDSSLWRLLYPELVAAGFRAVVIDFIGHGASEKVTDRRRYDRTALSRDLDALVDAIGTNVHLVAHDYGAVVGWQFSTLFPERVASYCALSIGHPAAILRNPSIASLLKNWFLVYNALPFAIPGYRICSGRFFRWAMRQHPDQQHVVSKFLATREPFYIRAWELGNPLPPMIRDYLFSRAHNIPKVKAPTLGIWGSKDAYAVEAQMKHSGAFVDNSFDYVRLDGLGHWLQLEAAAAVNLVILEWLRKQQMSGG